MATRFCLEFLINCQPIKNLLCLCYLPVSTEGNLYNNCNLLFSTYYMKMCLNEILYKAMHCPQIKINYLETGNIQ